MKILSLLLSALILLGCGGGSSNSTLDGSSHLEFTELELVGNVLVSKNILDFSITDEDLNDAIGTISLFDNGNYREIGLSSSSAQGYFGTNGEVAQTEQPWSILSNGDLQFDYDQVGICTATKVSDNGTELEVTGDCQNFPSLLLEDTLVRPLEFDQSSLEGKDVELFYDNTDSYQYSFTDDGFLNVYQQSFDEIEDLVLIKQGVLIDSLYENVVRVDYLESSENSIAYSLFILIGGGLTSGKLIEMNFIKNDVIREVHVRNISENSWGHPISEYYNSDSYDF